MIRVHFLQMNNHHMNYYFILPNGPFLEEFVCVTHRAPCNYACSHVMWTQDRKLALKSRSLITRDSGVRL